MKMNIAKAYSDLVCRSIIKIIFNPPATIVFWDDGDKTVVKVHNEAFDREKGLAMAIIKKIWAGDGHYRKFFKAVCSNDALYLWERYGVEAEYQKGSEKHRRQDSWEDD